MTVSKERHEMIVGNVIKRYKTRVNDLNNKHTEAVECLEEIRELTRRVVNGEWIPEVIYIHEVDKVLQKYFGEKSY